MIDNYKNLYMWGNNFYGQLAEKTIFHFETKPKLISSFDAKVKLFDAESDHSGIITDNNELYMWGHNLNGQVGDNYAIENISNITYIQRFNNVSHFSLGGNHSGLVDNNQKIYTWGQNNFGQLGNNNIQDLSFPTKILELENITDFNFGRYHSGMISENVNLYMWGDNYNGQIGNNSADPVYIPTLINYE